MSEKYEDGTFSDAQTQELVRPGSLRWYQRTEVVIAAMVASGLVPIWAISFAL